MSPNFLRCHKSFVINMNYIIGYKRYQFTLKNNYDVPISPRLYLKRINDYKNYLLIW
ncbi:MAG: LytTR family transcriptional regulator DNA-binding domain-containing protein [Eubacterium sp.]